MTTCIASLFGASVIHNVVVGKESRMAVASQPSSEVGTSLQELASGTSGCTSRGWGPMATSHEIPIITRGEGCYVFDEHGNRYLDGLSGLFCVNAGHGRSELGEAAARQVEELDFYTLWSYAHPRAIELAARLASLAPDGPRPRLLHQRRLGGGRVGAEASPQLPPDARQRPEAQGDRPRDRLPRHLAGGPLGDRNHRAARPVRAADPGRLPRAQHQRLPLARRSASRPGPPTRSRSGSSSRDRRRSPR